MSQMNEIDQVLQTMILWKKELIRRQNAYDHYAENCDTTENPGMLGLLASLHPELVEQSKQVKLLLFCA